MRIDKALLSENKSKYLFYQYKYKKKNDNFLKVLEECQKKYVNAR